MGGAEFLKASIFKHCSSTFLFPYTTFELVWFAGCFLLMQCYPTRDVCLLAPGANDFFSDAKGETHQCLMGPAFSVIKEVPLGWFHVVYIFPCKFTGSHEPALQVVQSHNVEVRSTKGYFGPFMLQHSSQLIKVNTEDRLLESHTENCTVGLFRFRGYLFLSFWLGLDFPPHPVQHRSRYEHRNHGTGVPETWTVVHLCLHETQRISSTFFKSRSGES